MLTLRLLVSHGYEVQIEKSVPRITRALDKKEYLLIIRDNLC